MSGFKLLAIRTGKRAENPDRKELFDFFKVLKDNVLYKFYNEYTFLNKDGLTIKGADKVNTIEYKEVIPADLYDQKSLNINVSAIVGKNGSGKSTLIELIFVSIYLLAIKYNQLEMNFEVLEELRIQLNKDEIRFNSNKDQFQAQSDKILNSFNQLKKKVFEIHDDDLKFFPGFELLKQKLRHFDRIIEETAEQVYTTSHKKWIDETENEINKIISSLDVELYYELNNMFYVLKIGNNKQNYVSFERINSNIPISKTALSVNRDFSISKFLDDPIDLSKHFFYTIAISYSHYGLNVKENGYWLNDLFHKNDSYQTPLVINPMRTDGNIDINRENDLVHQRLLSNLLEPIDKNEEFTLRHLAPNKKASKLVLKFNEDKFDRYREKHNLSNIINTEECVHDLYFAYTGIALQTYNEPTLEGTKYYLYNKLIKICSVYERYKTFIKNNEFENVPLLVSNLIDDRSHITFKLKQAMNFIRFKLINEREAYKEFEIDIETLSENIESTIKDENESDRQKVTIEFLPPPTFDFRIKLEDGSFFEKMSSGEKQKIHSIGSIAYHLINLNSVSKNGKQDTLSSFCKYKYINILFDEVEQYFHPDLQRTFVKDLLTYLDKINPVHVDEILGVNILFVTHSPFILSDISELNTIHLEDGFPSEDSNLKKTFGANLHDLLANDFFLKDGFIGEYSKIIIEDVISFLKRRETTYQWDIRRILEVIEMIGDPIIRHRLTDLYREWLKISTIERKELIEQKAMLEKQLSVINNKLR